MGHCVPLVSVSTHRGVTAAAPALKASWVKEAGVLVRTSGTLSSHMCFRYVLLLNCKSVFLPP